MSSNSIVVVDFGMGNIHSMIKALRLYHPEVVFSADPEVIRSAKGIVLPGDGAFGAAMDHLEQGPGDVVLERIAAGVPMLGVCIGFQVLFDDSTETSHKEDGGVRVGLGLVPGKIRKFQREGDLRIPHMGWNILEPDVKIENTPSYYSSYMYFIHSYRAEQVPEENVLAWCSYGSHRFPAVVMKDNILAVQFHPEKSDREGLKLIEDWVENHIK